MIKACETNSNHFDLKHNQKIEARRKSSPICRQAYIIKIFIKNDHFLVKIYKQADGKKSTTDHTQVSNILGIHSYVYSTKNAKRCWNKYFIKNYVKTILSIT